MTKIKFIVLLLLNFLLLPLYFGLWVVCFFLSFLPIFPSKTAKQNLQQQLNLTGIKANILITQVYMNYVYYCIEASVFHIFHLNICDYSEDFNFLDFYSELQQKYPTLQDKGVVYLLSHMANVEVYSLPVTSAFLAGKHSKLYALAQPSRINWLNRLLSWYRLRPGMGVLWTDKGLFTKMEQLIQTEKASFCLLVDQKPKSGGLFIRFFNDFAAFPTSGVRMCINQGLVIVYAAAYRVFPGYLKMKMQSGKNIHLAKQELVNYQQASVSDQQLIQATLLNNTEIKARELPAAIEMSFFTKWIETEISKHPNQWCWDYRKWSRKPK